MTPLFWFIFCMDVLALIVGSISVFIMYDYEVLHDINLTGIKRFEVYIIGILGLVIVCFSLLNIGMSFRVLIAS